MKAIGINGSPRKSWNTATLVKKCLEGAGAEGASCTLVHLYDLDFKGCISCFKCKKLNGRSYGRCAMKDGLTPIVEQIAACDVLVLGTPVYFGAETGAFRAFLERLIFPYHTYTPQRTSIFPGKVRAGLIYTMNVNEDLLSKRGYPTFMERTRATFAATLGSCERLLCTDTYQFSDYSKYLSTLWDVEAKARRRAEVFPRDCEAAQALGRRLARQAGSEGGDAE